MVARNFPLYHTSMISVLLRLCFFRRNSVTMFLLPLRIVPITNHPHIIRQVFEQWFYLGPLQLSIAAAWTWQDVTTVTILFDDFLQTFNGLFDESDACYVCPMFLHWKRVQLSCKVGDYVASYFQRPA